MKMINKELLIQQMKTSKDFFHMAEQLKLDVENFYKTFEDSPDKHSAWGHHYFCKEDGSVLEYNPSDPYHHICPICKKVYSSPLLDDVWMYLYRNEAALTILKAAILYKITDKKEYLDIVVSLASFYILSFEKFELHNKEGFFFDSIDTMKWGCGRIMPQNLNESIFFIRIFTGLEVVKEELPKDFMEFIRKEFCRQFYDLLNPQINKIHNISCWMNSALGVVGLFAENEKLIRFAFEDEFNINRQLKEGVTEDGFWYEGSIHYNFFTLEGILYLALFAKTYRKEFKELKTVEKMLVSAYNYAFSNQQLPNPNDGWPNINLKSYSYIYSVGTKVFGYESKVGEILAQILASDYERGEVPLSKPYYFDNRLSLEQFLLLPDFQYNVTVVPNRISMDFEKSNYALLKNESMDVFYKYGHHGPSHAHPDKMTIEVVFGKETLTKDLSNSGYGSVICNQWHRITASHNTVVVDGKNHTSVEPGIKLNFTKSSCDAIAEYVYDDVSFRRNIQLLPDGFYDVFEVKSDRERNYDFIFHVESELDMDLGSTFEIRKNSSLGYTENGYAYFRDIMKLIPLKGSKELILYWKLGSIKLASSMSIIDTEVFLAKSPANPITGLRTSIILRRKAKHTTYQMEWKIL